MLTTLLQDLIRIPSENNGVTGYENEVQQFYCRWLKDHGITVKGHPLCWHTVCADWLMNYSNEEILKKQLARIHREVSTYKGLIDMWDVINEVVIMPVFDKYDNAVTRICKEYGRFKLVKEVFEAAYAENPGATLLINDFNTSQSYEILVEGLLEMGVPMVIALNMMDEVTGNGGSVDVNRMESMLSVPVVPISAAKNQGIDELVRHAVHIAR